VDLAGLAEGRARPQEQVRADHRRVPGAVALEGAFDDLVAHPPVEIQVDVGQVRPADVQEAVQRQAEPQRVDVGDL
jgi:hypothetical protein